jgi:hypothetical protein
VVRRDIRPRPGLRANPPTLAPAPSGPTLLLPVFSSCPHARRGGPGRRWLWRRGAAGRHPGRVQWAAGQCRATQRQHGYELDIAQRAHAAIGAPLPALRVVITQIAGTSSRIVSQTTPTSTRRPRPVPSPPASSLGPCEDCLGHSIASWATAAPCTCRSVGRNHPEAVSARQGGHPSSGLARPAVRTRRHGPRRGRPPTPKQ